MLININLNPLSANPTKWSNTLKQFVVNLPTNFLSVFDHFVKLALKELRMPNLKNEKSFKVNQKTFFITFKGLLVRSENGPLPFKRQPHKMVKHGQTIRLHQPTNCLCVFDHFLGFALKRLK